MSDFYTAAKTVTARNATRCSYCGEGISPKDQYMFQKGNHDGRWFVSKMHPECFDDMCESGDGEYIPYSNERPASDNNQ